MFMKDLGVNFAVECLQDSIIACGDSKVCNYPSCLLASVPETLVIGCEGPSRDWYPTGCITDSGFLVDPVRLSSLEDLRKELKEALVEMEKVANGALEARQSVLKSLPDWQKWFAEQKQLPQQEGNRTGDAGDGDD